MQLEIFAYTPLDQLTIIQLFRLNTPEYFAQEEEGHLQEYLTNHIEDYFLIQEAAGTIVGAGGINYADDGKTAKISWDIIHPSFQGKGVGSALLQYRISLIKEKGIQQIIVRTSQQAYQFYQKNGFTLQHIEKDYWADGFDLYYMIYSS